MSSGNRKKREVREVRLFVASPGDVKPERERMVEITERLNRTLDAQGFAVKLYLYERNLVPELGEIQSLINPDVDRSDIVLLVVWKRLGTPTRTARSGTEEEVLRTLQGWRTRGRPRMHTYVCKRPIPADDLESDEALDQKKALNAFLKSLGEIAASKPFADTEDFSEKVYDDLLVAIPRLFQEDADLPDARPQPNGRFDEARYLRHIEDTCGFVALTGLLAEKAAAPVRIEDVYVSLTTARPLSPDSLGRFRHGAARLEEFLQTPTAEIAKILSHDGPVRRPDGSQLHSLARSALLELGVESDQAYDDAILSRLTARLLALGADPSPLQVENVCRTIEVEDVLRQFAHVVIEGDPGSGKTTILQRAALALARARTGRPADAERMGFATPFPIPIFVPVRRFGAWLAGLDPRPPADDASLLRSFLVASEGTFGFDEPWLARSLETGAVVVLLDGLDEIHDAAVRERVATIVLDFVQVSQRARFVLSSRPAGLAGTIRARLSASGRLATCTVNLLSDAQLEPYARAWFRALAPDARDAERRGDELVARLRARGDVVDLARVPVMLTGICVVHLTIGEIPELRAELYERLVRALAHRIDFERDEFGRVLCGPVPLEGKLRVLQELAHEVHTSAADARRIEAGTVSAIALRELPPYLELNRPPTREHCEAIVAALIDRSGLLLPDGARAMRFRHHTFQEFLTARRICDRAEDAAAELAARLEDPWWREVIQLAPAYLAMSSSSNGRKLWRGLAEEARSRARPEDRAVALACVARAALDLRKFRVPGLEEDARSSFGAIVELLEHPEQPGGADARDDLAALLGSFGDDPRLTDQRRWVSIPTGGFLMGGELPDEKPVHQVRVPAFELQRWTTTVGEFQSFVESDGYAKRDLWDEVAWRWRKDEAIEVPADWERQVAGPSNLPVVGVSWWEARAYCRWLTAKLVSAVRPAAVRLPSEAEWEYACRAGTTTRYSCGEDDGVADAAGWYDENSLGKSHAVGLKNANSWGLVDMHGNVWEWCRDSWCENYEGAPVDGSVWENEASENRVLRGGSIRDNAEFARSACRYGFRPSIRWLFVGFRPARSS